MKIACEACLFDNDGVLVDSHAQVGRAWGKLAQEFGLDIDLLLSELAGVRASDTLGRHLPDSHVDAAVARLEVLEIELADTTRPLAGARELTAQLPHDRWTIVTSASRPLAEARWRGAGIIVPPSTVTADDVTHGKPHPEPFLAAANALDAPPSHCVVFEDSAAGGAAGVAAGATVIAVGSQPWVDEPIARVRDLSEVQVHMNSDGKLVLEVASSE